ncbi:MAG: hypothetical protein AABX48_00725 [Nanoarchaeota archaeon]
MANLEEQVKYAEPPKAYDMSKFTNYSLGNYSTSGYQICKGCSLSYQR